MELIPGHVDTARLRTHCWTGGSEDGTPVLLVHGNLVTGAWWRPAAAYLPAGWRVVAPDLRGFGRTEPLPIDATRGLADWCDDLRALIVALGWADRPVHLVGWSMGGGVVWRYAIDRPAEVASLTLVAPVPPYGYGGTKGPEGTPCFADFAGSGGGVAAADFVRRLAARDRSDGEPTSVPTVMRTFFGARGNAAAVDEDALLDEVLLTATGDDHYPGDSTPSENWPGVAPGTRGVLNTMTPGVCDLSGFADVSPQPPVLWTYGVEDQVVSDASMFDVAQLGRLGAVPGWPGDDVAPPQPQWAQTRAVLDRYRANGGRYEEVALDGVAHGLPVEVPERLAGLLMAHVGG